MSQSKNLFSKKNNEQLSKLYEQFLKYEKIGSIPADSELGRIRDVYCQRYPSNSLSMLQFDLLHAISDAWYKNYSSFMQQDEIYELCELKKHLDTLDVEEVSNVLRELNERKARTLLMMYAIADK